jgi:hypothetical protein
MLAVLSQHVTSDLRKTLVLTQSCVVLCLRNEGVSQVVVGGGGGQYTE